MIKHTYFNPSKMWNELSIDKTQIGPSWHGPSFASWAESACAEFYVGRFGMGRVGFGPSCPAPLVTTHGKATKSFFFVICMLVLDGSVSKNQGCFPSY